MGGEGASPNQRIMASLIHLGFTPALGFGLMPRQLTQQLTLELHLRAKIIIEKRPGTKRHTWTRIRSLSAALYPVVQQTGRDIGSLNNPANLFLILECPLPMGWTVEDLNTGLDCWTA